MREPSSPPHVSRSSIGLDTSVKRTPGSKTMPKTALLPARPSTPRSFFAGRRKFVAASVFAGFLCLSMLMLVKELRPFSYNAELTGTDPPSSISAEGEGQQAPAGAAAEGTSPVPLTGVLESETIQQPEAVRLLQQKQQEAALSKQREGDVEQKDASNGRGRGRKSRRRDRRRDGSGVSGAGGTQLQAVTPNILYNPLEPDVPPSHRCGNFTLPPPPRDPKRTGPRPCPVCYLPPAEALGAHPARERESARPVLKELTFVTLEDPGEQDALRGGKRPRFAGHQTLEQRRESFDIREKMRVHCGFVPGRAPGDGSGFDSSEEDRAYMASCTDMVVVSAIFGAYDLMQQPSSVSEEAKERVCFAMFVDEPTFDSLLQDGTLPSPTSRQVGLWRLVVVKNIPYGDPRRTGKIPKLLPHRLFPNAQFSLWIDAKLELRVDPIQIFERFLWRGGFTWAISKHYKRFDVFEEAERNKEAGKYKNATIDAQMEVYRSEGMTPFTEAKLPIISDVPEGCVIVREHVPLTNLLACIWYNEVERFTSRDQLSFGFCRDRVRAGVPGWNVNMFLDCQRRNFVTQVYHKDVLKQKFGNVTKAIATDRQA